jgi:glycosyltransferase involved in cell wall biosynthesis
MACGCPVIASNVAAIPEIGGEAARYASPDDPEAWIASMRQLFDRPDETAGRRETGLERVRHFTWRATAQATLALYRELWETKRPG